MGGILSILQQNIAKTILLLPRTNSSHSAAEYYHLPMVMIHMYPAVHFNQEKD